MPESAFKTALCTQHSHTETHELVGVTEGNSTGKKVAPATFSLISMLKCYLVLEVFHFSINVRYMSSVPHMAGSTSL